MPINLKPTKCNICGGDVILTSNSVIYGKEFGNGKIYYCTSCEAYVGTHKYRDDEAMGILANKETRELRLHCHKIFDEMWTTKKERSNLYKKLADKLKINLEDCHFGYMDYNMLNEAWFILMEWRLNQKIPRKKGKK